MIITELYIRNFGKFSERHFYLKEGIQVISGENEFGKSTLHAFIKAMLFGLERGRGRAAANDEFSRYEPWENPGVYGGVMRFVCGGRRFRLERDFARYTKRVSLVCEDDGEELSVEQGDLDMLLGSISAEIFDSTVSVGQLRAQPGQELSDALRDYAANYYETGGGEYNLSTALHILDEKHRETERCLRREAAAADMERRKMLQESSYLRADIERLDRQYEEKTYLQEGLKTEKSKDAGAGKAGCGRAAAGAVLILVGAAAGIAAAMLQEPGRALMTAVILIGVVFAAAGAMLLAGGIKLWNRHPTYRDSEPAEKWNSLSGELTHIRNERREKQLRYENLNEQIEELEKSGKQADLEEKKHALELAAERLKLAAKSAGEHTEQRISEDLSRIFSVITDGRYRAVNLGYVKSGLQITVWDGIRQIPLNRLSRGTVEQIYFALRMAAAEKLLEEPFPVILDDVFAFYDDKRLRSVLQWLGREKKQVLLFSCHRREEQILNELK